jgi:hypothetical protein
MTPQITFYPVGNGDMTLLRLESGRTILIDSNIRKPGDDIRDVAKDLRDALQTDEKGHPYVDVMVMSHPDQDHCRGLREHFHMGPLIDYREKSDESSDLKKIIIREMWSSPLVFRRSDSKNHGLCEDAKAWNTEARRRVKRFKEYGLGSYGDRILILGEDVDGKTNTLSQILVKEGERISEVCGDHQANFSALLLAPLLANDAQEDEDLSKNESSVIMNYSFSVGGVKDAVKFLSGGDAEVAIWERQWARHKSTPEKLEYNLLLTPHHCSWHSMSHDSWSTLRRKVKVSDDALAALSQALPGAAIVASSNIIKDDEVDPPSIRAKEEYEAITKNVKGEFWNTSAYLSAAQQEPLMFEVSAGGLKRVRTSSTAASRIGGAVGGGIGGEPLGHG